MPEAGETERKGKLPMTTTIARNPELTKLAERVNQAHRQCQAAARSAVEHALEAGRSLIEAKAQVQHGQWLPWLTESCQCSERMAQNYMRIAREWPSLDSKTKRVADLSLRDGLKLLSAEKQPQTMRDSKDAEGYWKADDPDCVPLPEPGIKLLGTIPNRREFVVEIAAQSDKRYVHITVWDGSNMDYLRRGIHRQAAVWAIERMIPKPKISQIEWIELPFNPSNELPLFNHMGVDPDQPTWM